MQIYVSNLAWAITEDDLSQLFEAYGTVASVRPAAPTGRAAAAVVNIGPSAGARRAHA